MKRELGFQSIEKLKKLGIRLIDHRECKILIHPQCNGEGLWFGSGNLTQVNDGTIISCGKFRNQGDSRTGTGAGKMRTRVCHA